MRPRTLTIGAGAAAGGEGTGMAGMLGMGTSCGGGGGCPKLCGADGLNAADEGGLCRGLCARAYGAVGGCEASSDAAALGG